MYPGAAEDDMFCSKWCGLQVIWADSRKAVYVCTHFRRGMYGRTIGLLDHENTANEVFRGGENQHIRIYSYSNCATSLIVYRRFRLGGTLV